MKIPRGVCGARLADLLCRKWQYARVHQVGSHIILETAQPTHHRIAIPDHHSLRVGTLSSILRSHRPALGCPARRDHRRPVGDPTPPAHSSILIPCLLRVGDDTPDASVNATPSLRIVAQKNGTSTA